MEQNKNPNGKKSRFRPSLIWLVLLLFFAMELFSSSCFFYSVIGIPCAGCGSTRALSLLMQGELKEAIRMHPLIILSLVIFLSLLGVAATKLVMKARGKEFRSPLSEKSIKILFVSLVALYLIVYVVRMVLYFPNEEPMCYNHNSVWGRLVALFGNCIRR
jgi:glucan phosphoethanolaminetransferase (alkaline phosphatase superfamily)